MLKEYLTEKGHIKLTETFTTLRNNGLLYRETIMSCTICGARFVKLDSDEILYQKANSPTWLGYCNEPSPSCSEICIKEVIE